MSKHSLSILLYFLTISCIVFGQENYELKLNFNEDNQSQLVEVFSGKTEFESLENLEKSLQQGILQLHRLGHLEASIDTVHAQNLITANLTAGPVYRWAFLKVNSEDDVFLNNSGYREKYFKNKPFTMEEVFEMQNRAIKYAENNGYPFASSQLTNITVAENFSAELVFNKNQLVTIDSLIIVGEPNVNYRFIKKYLAIDRGDVYNEAKLKKIDKLINDLKFLQTGRPTQIEFVNDKANVYVYLKSKEASNFDLLIGLLPNNNEEGKLTITGQGEFNLQNVFKAGETMHLSFSKIQSNTRKLDIGFQYPYLPILPLGLQTDLNVFIKDTSYRDVELQLGFNYQFTGSNSIAAYVNNHRTDLLRVDTTSIKSQKALPNIIDKTQTNYGLNYQFQNFDYLYNPSKGIGVSLISQVGVKTIRKNNAILRISSFSDSTFSAEDLYNDFENKTLQIQVGADINKFWRLNATNTIKTQLSASTIYGDNLFQNDLNRIGGAKKLRGFDDESIFTSLHAILSIEYRYLLNRGSYLSLFYDRAYIESNTVEQTFSDRPYGFGAGFAFATASGTFALNYAIGSQQNNPIQFRSAKIHFGYINYF